MDIIYPIKDNKSNQELKYSLRSLSNLHYDKVFIIGDLPDFINIKNINYIYSNKLESRYQTTTKYLKEIILNKNVSEDFIWMNDDFFILKPVTEKDLLLNRGYLKDQILYYYKYHNPITNFDKLVAKAAIELKKLGFKNPLSFELHCPIIINKSKCLSILDKIKDESLHCCKRSLYGNYFIKNSIPISDMKVISSTIFDEKNYDKFLSCSENTFKKVEDFLKKKFPSKSIYEL